MDKEVNQVVVIGASAGGKDALKKLVAQFPPDFPAPVFIVRHISAEASGHTLVKDLNDSGSLACVQAKHEQAFTRGCIYLAPSDHHMLIEQGRILVTKGARENRSRPAIDPLFRSAAVAYGNRVIGIILTGYLDDGTSGMAAIKRCGGICIAQDPNDAAYPDMPQSVIANVGADYCLPVAGMGAVLSEVLGREPPPKTEIPDDIKIEARIAQRVVSDVPTVEALGDQVPVSCPECGGSLWEMAAGEVPRYRCHTGHAFTALSLLAEQTDKIQETLWVALRLFEERQHLLVRMSKNQTGNASSSVARRAHDSQVHIERIRAMLQASDESLKDAG